MKIYRQVIVDIASDTVLSTMEFTDVGSVARAKGGKKSSSSTTISFPPPTAEETEQKLMANKANILAMKSQGYKWNGSDFVPLEKGDYSAQELEDQELEGLYRAEAMKRAKAGFGATPEEKAAIEKIYGTSQKRGSENIRQFLSELSGSRGMDVAESSPLAREAGRAVGELSEGLEGARSASEVDFGERSRNFGQELRNFQQGLQQRAFENRITSGSLSGGMANNMAQLRSQQSTTTTKNKTSGGGGLFGSLLGAAGQIGSAFFM